MARSILPGEGSRLRLRGLLEAIRGEHVLCQKPRDGPTPHENAAFQVAF